MLMCTSVTGDSSLSVGAELVKRLSELVIPSFINHFTISSDVSGKPSEPHFITNCLDCNFVTAKLTRYVFLLLKL